MIKRLFLGCRVQQAIKETPTNDELEKAPIAVAGVQVASLSECIVSSDDESACPSDACEEPLELQGLQCLYTCGVPKAKVHIEEHIDVPKCWKLSMRQLKQPTQRGLGLDAALACGELCDKCLGRLDADLLEKVLARV